MRLTLATAVGVCGLAASAAVLFLVHDLTGMVGIVAATNGAMMAALLTLALLAWRWSGGRRVTSHVATPVAPAREHAVEEPEFAVRDEDLDSSEEAAAV